MGLSLDMLTLTFLPSAVHRAMRIYITTRLLSLAGPGGIFDIPNAKCPPLPGGSSDCVTGSRASPFYMANSSYPRHDIAFPPGKHFLPITPDASPNSSLESLPFTELSSGGSWTIPRNYVTLGPTTPATPPHTPESSLGRSGKGYSSIDSQQSSAAFEFLTTLFPHSGLAALPHAKSVKITSPGLGNIWNGVILELPPKQKGGQCKRTLYVNGQGAENVQLRESIVALLDLADEHFGCSAFVIALDRSSPALADLLHSLMYVGGTVVTSPPFALNPSYVLVGMEM